MDAEPGSDSPETPAQEPGDSTQARVRIEKLKSLIIRAFCAYAAAITALRLFGAGRLAMGIVEGYAMRGRGGMTLGGWAFAAMPAAIAACAARSRLGARSRACLMCFAALAALNHLAYLAVFMANFGWAAAFSLNYAKVGPFIMLGLASFMLFLLAKAWELARLEGRGPLGGGGPAWAAAVFLVFALSPLASVSASDALGAAWGLTPFGKVRVIAEADCAAVKIRGSEIRPSPDGKLLAYGGQNGLAVLDAGSMEVLFEDRSIGVRSLCFSPDGKYLAAAGESIPPGTYYLYDVRDSPEDLGALALYDVAGGFRRERGAAIPPEADGRRKTRATAVAFRPDGKSLLCAYYSYWDVKLFDGEGKWRGLQAREDESPTAQIPIFLEVEVPSGATVRSWAGVRGERLARRHMNSLGSFRFSPDASKLFYFDRFEDKSTPGVDQRNISMIDTGTWEGKLFRQEDLKYLVRSLHPELAGSGKLYFYYQLIRFSKMEGIGNGTFVSPGESVLAELDLGSAAIRDIIGSNIAPGRGRRETVFWHIAFSPDGREAALLGTAQKSRTQPSRDRFEFFVAIVSLSGEPRPRVKRYRMGLGGKFMAGHISWLSEGQLAISATDYTQGRIFKIDLESREGDLHEFQR
jgi:hypothetical protein